MAFRCGYRIRILCFLLVLSQAAIAGFAGVSRAIQDQYRQNYANKAMVLKIPIYAEKQLITISGRNYRVEQGSGVPRYKVGDQLRVLGIDFSGDLIRFRMGGIGVAGMVELDYKFDTDLQEDFPNRDVFNQALQATLTEGLKYSEIEDAKSAFIEDQFDRSVQSLAASASISREAALKSIAPFVPAYQEARKDIESLRNKIQDLSGQLAGVQSENRKLESQLRDQQAELARMKSTNASLQEKMNSSLSQVSRLGDELRDAKGSAQGYQKELTNIQRSLNLKVDAGRDLAAQIADLGQLLRKLQKENDALDQQVNTLRTSLESQQAANARLVGENEELKNGNQKLQRTIETLTSNKDSLAGQYVQLKNEKEKLDEFSQGIKYLRTRVTDEKIENGARYGKAQVYLSTVLVGSLEWRIPDSLRHGQSQTAEAVFAAESIDYIRATPDEKQMLRTLGDKLRIRIELTSTPSMLKIAPVRDKPIHAIGERDRSEWTWSLSNQGTQDSRILLTAHLINRNDHQIPLLQQEYPLIASNAVRQIRNYLQPVPLVVGIVLGFLLFGIAGIFRKHKSPKGVPPATRAGASPPSEHIHKKQL